MDRNFSAIFDSDIQGRDSVLSIRSMNDFWVWLGYRLISLSIVLVVFVFVFDLMMPPYSDVIISKKARTNEGISALVSFKKSRNCTPIPGSAVAFLKFGQDYRMPVNLLNSRGKALRMQNFPPSKTPITTRLTWEAHIDVPMPDAIILAFDVSCITPIDQTITWSSPVNFK